MFERENSHAKKEKQERAFSILLTLNFVKILRADANGKNTEWYKELLFEAVITKTRMIGKRKPLKQLDFDKSCINE